LVTDPAASPPRPDRRVRKTLEQYFAIPIAADHPLLEQVELRQLAGGEWLMHQGAPGESLYFLVRGRLQAWAADGSGHERHRFLNEIVPGDSVGEMSLLTGAPRSVGVQAIRDSLLVRIDREDFERLSREYPALALRLAANVAALLQSTGRARPSTRNLKAISLLPLDSTPRTAAFCRRFAEMLEAEGPTLSLTGERLGIHGAPIAAVAEDKPVPPELLHWLHDQEDDFRFVVYHGSAERPNWTEFALRQSDMVLFVGDVSESPDERPWEARFGESAGAALARRLLVLLQPGHEQPICDTRRWLAARKVDFHVHVRDDEPGDLGRVVRIVSGRALGLVLAGGAARGFAHLGVYRAMLEAGLPVDWIGGTSLGAIMAAALASPWSPDEAVAIVRDCFVEGKPFSDFTLPLVSLIRGRRMDRLLHRHLNFMIEDLPTPFFCVSCHLDSGSMKVHDSGNLADALRASASIPGIIPPAVVDGRLTVDGAVINNLPVDIMQQKPVGTIVAVDLSADQKVMVDYPAMPSPWAVLRGRYLPFARRYRVPGLSTVLLKATELGTLERVRQLGRQADLLLHPPVRQFGMTEVKSFDRIVQAGYEHARAELAAWLERRQSGG
jgi:predicted acylesterase/phospholipase RssA/CRP-like cAMP-binding protein